MGELNSCANGDFAGWTVDRRSLILVRDRRLVRMSKGAHNTVAYHRYGDTIQYV